jgi:uncharacterized protein
MTSKRDVEDFMAQRSLAVVGVSRNGQGFGNLACRELKARGYRVFTVHPDVEDIAGEPCYPSLKALPEPVGGVLIVVPPAATGQVVQQAAEAGIRRVWMQQGAESAEALRFCEAHGMEAISGECILMFAEPPAFIHRAHRWLCKLTGRLPQ